MKSLRIAAYILIFIHFLRSMARKLITNPARTFQGEYTVNIYLLGRSPIPVLLCKDYRTACRALAHLSGKDPEQRKYVTARADPCQRYPYGELDKYQAIPLDGNIEHIDNRAGYLHSIISDTAWKIHTEACEAKIMAASRRGEVKPE